MKLSRLLVFAVIVGSSVGMSAPATGETLVFYSAETGVLPAPPWEFISNGPPFETSQHTVFVEPGILHVIDNALFLYSTLGYLQHIPVNPNQVIDVEFRARVMSGESAIDERAPFQVWLLNGMYQADMSVGPTAITALGRPTVGEFGTSIVLNIPLDGTEWHTYHYKLTPTEIRWFVDGIPLARAGVDRLIIAETVFDRRINMMITSAAADVELAYIKVDVATSINIDVLSKKINPNSAGLTRVAILTTESFDAATVDPQTISFGKAGTEATGLRSVARDVDNDGDIDLVFWFRSPETGIQCGDVTATLTAKTVSGEDLEGSDFIQTGPCK
jgi:hypothetical protein